ncbi:MAG: hypothetical protein IPP19_07270 [Verrucomicrobia bacterium]|nr:hypothetical protein [Verrucomicrobiota bacterium]
MTLPSQLPSTEPAAIPSDPFACLGAASAQNTVTTPCDASFASVFSQAGEAAPTMVGHAPVASIPTLQVSAGLPGMYSGIAYMASGLQPGPSLQPINGKVDLADAGILCSRTPSETSDAGEMVDSDEEQEAARADDQPATEVALTYQLIAGQWMPQPTAQPAILKSTSTGEKSGTPNERDNATQVTRLIPDSKGFPQGRNAIEEPKRTTCETAAPAVPAQGIVSQPSPVASAKVSSTTVAQPMSAQLDAKSTAAFAVDAKNITAPKDFAPPKNAIEKPERATGETAAPSAPVQGVVGQPSAVASGIVSSTAFAQPMPAKVDAKSNAAFAIGADKNLPLPTEVNSAPIIGSGAAAAPVLAKAPELGVAPAITLTALAGTPVENAAPAADIRITSDAREKFAAPRGNPRGEIESGVNPSIGGKEKKTVIVDGKKVNTTASNVGTRGANREISMPYSVSNKTASAEFTTTQAFAMPGGIQIGTTAPLAATTAPIEVQAPRLVEEIRAIADRISVIDRNSVEVRFDFNDSERLSVRVEYRDGTVHTTFRTDSSQLRDVISTEWQAQAAASEQRSYRVADPVFNSPNAKQQEFSSLGDGSGRQRSYDQSAQSGGAPSFGNTGRSTGATTTVAPLPATRSETSRHLQTFA